MSYGTANSCASIDGPSPPDVKTDVVIVKTESVSNEIDLSYSGIFCDLSRFSG
jgi:hypothetical protein